MTDAEYRAVMKKIQKYLNFWIDTLGLRVWDITQVYYRDGFQEDEGSHKGTIARVIPAWEYQSAKIEFNVLDLCGLDDRVIETMVIHELAHLLVSEMANEDTDYKHLERTVVGITNALKWTRKEALKEGAKNKK